MSCMCRMVNDSGAGILRIEYSLDNGHTVQTYTEPFTISASGQTTIQVKAIDKLGNEEIPQSVTVEIIAPPSSTANTSGDPARSADGSLNDSQEDSDSPEVNSTTNTSITTNSSIVSSKTKPSQDSISSVPDVLGINNVSNILSEQKESIVEKAIEKTSVNPAAQMLGGLLMVSGGIITIVSLGLAATFLKPFPHKM